MRKLLSFFVASLFLLLWPSAHAESRPVHVTFTNRSGWNVSCLLSGGNGLQTRINSNTTRSYTAYSNNGVMPTITVYQINSGQQVFNLRDGGNYLIILDKRGKLVVTFAN